MQIKENQVAVITGAAGGVGKALAFKCVREKMNVVLADLNKESLDTLKLELGQAANVITVVTDISKREDLVELANTTYNNFGKINLLLNIAGIAGQFGPLWEIEEKYLSQIIDINFFGTLNSLRIFIPLMLKQKEPSYIVNTSSIAAFTARENIGSYMMTKAAITALTEATYLDLKVAGANIGISILCLGEVNTNLLRQSNELKETSPSYKKTHEFTNKLKTLVDKGIAPNVVAEAVFSAISNDQLYILVPDEVKTILKERMDNILNGKNPEEFKF